MFVKTDFSVPLRVLKHTAFHGTLCVTKQAFKEMELKSPFVQPHKFPPVIYLLFNLHHCATFMIQPLWKRLRNVFCIAAAKKKTAHKKTIMIKRSKSAVTFSMV